MQRERRGSGVPIGMVFAMFAGAIVLNVAAGFAAHHVIETGWEGPLPRSDAFMEVALVPGEGEEEETKEEEEREELLDGELVENHRLLDERPPEKETERISEFDNRVEHETRAPNRPDTPGGAPQKPGDSPNGQQGKSKENNEADRPDTSDSERDAAAQDGKGQAAADDDLVAHDDGERSSDQGASSASKLPGLMGSHAALRDTFGSRGSMDRLQDVDDGAENLLETRRHRFASFFNRVRSAVAEHWHPDVVHAARDPYGKVHGTKTRVTRLMIRLNPDGSLKQIVVDKRSGVEYLDEEAIRAVRTAQPFTNPPEQLIDPATGFIDFGFVFIFEIGGSSRIHRYQF